MDSSSDAAFKCNSCKFDSLLVEYLDKGSVHGGSSISMYGGVYAIGIRYTKGTIFKIYPRN